MRSDRSGLGTSRIHRYIYPVCINEDRSDDTLDDTRVIPHLAARSWASNPHGNVAPETSWSWMGPSNCARRWKKACCVMGMSGLPKRMNLQSSSVFSVAVVSDSSRWGSLGVELTYVSTRLCSTQRKARKCAFTTAAFVWVIALSHCGCVCAREDTLVYNQI